MDKLQLRWPLAEAAYDHAVFAAYMQGRLYDPADQFSPYIHIKPQYGYERVDAFLDGPMELKKDATYNATVQLNPARTASLFNGGCGLCPFDMLQPIAHKGFEALQHLLPAACSWQEVQVTRIDLARDFAVDDPAQWVEQGRGVRHRHARNQALYVGRDGSAQTLVGGVKGQRSQLYDKQAECKDEQCSTWYGKHNLRFESQLTYPKVMPNGLGTLERLTTRNLQRALSKLWDESRTGNIRLTPSAGQLVAASNLGAHDKVMLLGWLESRRMRLALDDGLRKEERIRLRKQAADLGISVRGNSFKTEAQVMMLGLVLGQPVPVDA